jgi:ribosomal protein S18 acetylase RimI-like enzyme
MDNFTIKKLEEGDWQIWKNFRLEALKHSPESFGSSYEEEANWKDSDFQNSLTKSDVFGVFVDNSLISCTGNSVKTKHRCVIWGMYTKAEYRGRGIASALIQKVINYAKPRIIQLHLTCVKSNLEAIRLYHKHGFKVYGEEPNSLKIENQYVNEYMMVLVL